MLFNIYVKKFIWQIVLLGVATLLTAFVVERVNYINTSPALIVFSILLFSAEMHMVFHLYGMIYCLWPRNYKRYTHPNISRSLRINIFICVCGEPSNVVWKTMYAAKKAVHYYMKQTNPIFEPQIYILNDGKVANKDNFQVINQLSEFINIKNITREIPGGYKAGNINNAINATPTSDPVNTLDIVLDADFSAKEFMLTEIVKPFADEKVDFAQSPQRYKNEKTWVAKASAAHQIFFFDHICSSKGHDNALFLCGTNFAIRRNALNDIGGMDDKFITEDYATSLKLHLNGKKGVFIPRVLAEGIAPASLKQYFSQQRRWSKGSFDVSFAFLKQIVFGTLTLRQKFHYLLSATYYLIGVRDFILILAPLPFLLFGVSLVNANSISYLMFIYAPLIITNLILYLILFRHPLKSLVLDIASFPVFAAAFLSSVLKKDLSFIVTIKRYEKENPFSVYKVQLFVAGLLGIGLFISFNRPYSNGAAVLNYFWAVFDVAVLSLGFYLVFRENYNTRFLDKVLLTPVKLLNFIRTGFNPRSPVLRFICIFAVTLFTGFSVYNIPIFKVHSSWINDIESTEPVKQKDLLVPFDGVYYGYYKTHFNSHPANPETEIIPEEKTSLVMYYQDWNNEVGFDTEYMLSLSRNGRVPIITWEPWDTSRNYPDLDLNQIEYDPQLIIEGKYDDYIRTWARDAADYKQPFFLRFAHEMNGNWYTWGNMNGPETYVKMWRHVHDIFADEGATNVIWVWSPNNTDEFGSSESIDNYYPGDNYVDWVAFSGFNWGTGSGYSNWKSFNEIAGSAYGALSKYNKPIMVAETSSASTGGNKTEWFKNTLKEIKEYPMIKAIIFFDEDKHNADFGLNSGQNFEDIVREEIVLDDYFLKSPFYSEN